jgi:hypothetical protein
VAAKLCTSTIIALIPVAFMLSDGRDEADLCGVRDLERVMEGVKARERVTDIVEAGVWELLRLGVREGK